MTIKKVLRICMIEHPLFWIYGFALLFSVQASIFFSASTSVYFNFMEILLGKSLLKGWGYSFAPLDPPGLSRPVFAPLCFSLIETFVQDPIKVFQIFYVLTLLSLVSSIFYLMRKVYGKKAAHFSLLVALVTPLFSYSWQGGHIASHLAFLSVIGWAILALFSAWETKRKGKAFLAGILWGVVFLSRYEMLFLFSVVTVSSAFFFKRKLIPFLLLIIGFLVCYLPKEIYYSKAAKKYGIFQDNSIHTFYTGEILTNNREAGRDGKYLTPENAGYAKGIELYGPTDKYPNFLSFVIQNPLAVTKRFIKNMVTGYNLILRFPVFFFAPLLGFLFFLLHPAFRQTQKATFLFFLFLASHLVFIFHVDARYLIPTTVFAFIALLFALHFVLFELIPTLPSRARHLAKLGLFLSLVLSGANTHYLPPEITPERLSPETYQKIGAEIKAFSKGSPLILRSHIRNTDLYYLQLMISYYADTAIAWGFIGPWPQDKIAAFKAKRPDYYLLDEPMNTPDTLELVYQITTSETGKLYLYKVRPGVTGELDPMLT